MSVPNAPLNLLAQSGTRKGCATQDADRERYNLANMIGTLRGKQDQRFWLMIVGSNVFVFGFMAFPFVFRAVPFGMNADIAAAIIMEACQWDAGIVLMESGNLAGRAQLTTNANLVSANRDKITECQKTATTSKKDERCAITVKAQ